MKISTARTDAFIRRPDPQARAILLYGPDAGLVRERADALARTVTDDLADPFRVAELDAAALKDDPARLGDEAAALSLSGGRRVLRIRGATDAVTTHFKQFLGDPSGDALVIVEAGELGRRSSLRGLFEAAANGRTLACYGDAPRELERLAREELRQHGVSITSEALAYLLENLGNDRLVTRNELAKLALYVGDGGAVGLEEAMACIGDSAALSLNDIIHAAADGDQGALDRASARAYLEGASPVTVLRAAARHFQRLHLVAGLVAAGQSFDHAIAQLKPRLSFKPADRLRAQLGWWRAEPLATALERLTQAEAACKETGMPKEAICTRTLMDIAAVAAAERGSR